MATFNPLAYPFSPYGGYQPYIPPVQQPQQQNNNGMIWVQGRPGANAHLVGPNSTAVLWDSEEQLIYIKSADASGMPSIKTLKYEVVEEKNDKKPSTNYVTKEDFNDFTEKMYNEIASLRLAIPNKKIKEVNVDG